MVWEFCMCFCHFVFYCSLFFYFRMCSHLYLKSCISIEYILDLMAIWTNLASRFIQTISSIVSYCDRSTKQFLCICLVVYCFKLFVIVIVIVWLANQRAASSSYWSIQNQFYFKKLNYFQNVQNSVLSPGQTAAHVNACS